MIISPMFFKNAGLLCALFLFVACNEEKAEKLKSEISAITAEVREAKDNRNALKAKERELKQLISNYERFQKKDREIRADLNEVADYHGELKAAVDYTSSLTEKWKLATRKSLIGEQLGLVRMADKTLANAIVVGLDKEKVILEYTGGQGSFELSELPEALRKKLIHEPTILLEFEIGN